MNKELIAKQKKFLGLFFGMWALLFLNSALGWFVIEIGILIPTKIVKSIPRSGSLSLL